MTLEELIRDRAAKGEMVHLSLAYSAIDNTWAATYAASQSFGVSGVRHKDPITAMTEAILDVKSSKKKITATVIPNPSRPKKEKLDDWLPKP